MDKNTMDAKMYTAFCSDFDLKPEWLGKKFTDERGETHTITGLNPRSKKFPVVTDTGTSFSSDYLTALLTNSVDKYEQKQRNAFQKEQEKMLKAARSRFASECSFYGVPKTWLDKAFKYGRKVYTIVGIDAGRRYPVVARSNDGKVMFFAADLVKESIGEGTK